ncbi:MAG: HNH endonuclease [Candidatus Promineifilaceae bacterium]
MANRNWTRNELILAFNLYCKLPFGKMHNRNPQVIALANLIKRSHSAVSWKLVNFARLDPSLQKRGIRGATHGSKGEIEIWNEFSEDWERLAYESESLIAEFQDASVEVVAGIDTLDLPVGEDRYRLVKTRVNQSFFRKAVLASYDSKCCITELPLQSLLVASHIIPWAQNASHRTDPSNGLCLNAIHDKAFDRGLLTITTDYQIKLSTELVKLENEPSIEQFFSKYENQTIRLPRKFIPNPVFLAYHNEHIFLG